MAGGVITVSPRVPVDELLRLARTRLARDGVAALAVSTGDQRQVRQLRRLAHRLDADDTLDCYLGDHSDGAIYLTVYLQADRERRRGLGWWGDPKVT
jgi:hypothetical protein